MEERVVELAARLENKLVELDTLYRGVEERQGRLELAARGQGRQTAHLLEQVSAELREHLTAVAKAGSPGRLYRF